jgi:hypothetical protein
MKLKQKIMLLFEIKQSAFPYYFKPYIRFQVCLTNLAGSDEPLGSRNDDKFLD